MRLTRFLMLIPLLAEIFIPEYPPISIRGFDYITIPPLSPNRDNPINIGVIFGNESDYTLTIRYKHLSEGGSYEIYNETGHTKRLNTTAYFPKDKVESGRIALFIYVYSDAFQNGEISIGMTLHSIIPANVALTSNYVTSFATEENYYSYSLFAKPTEQYYAEKYKFYDFQREQEQSYYNYLDLDRINFSYTSAPDAIFTYQDCYIYLQNYNHWFDNIGTVFGNFRKIPISIINKGDAYHFELKDTIYVDKNTNRLFSACQENTFPTKKLFLPKNGYTTDKIQMNLNIKGVGYNEANISQTFLFSINRNYFGDCYNSEYCISGSEAESNFEYGEIEER